MTQTLIPAWTLADRLRKARKAAGLEQDHIAEQLGVARTTIAGWENGHHTPATLYVREWATITGVDLGWLRGGGVTTTDTTEYLGVLAA